MDREHPIPQEVSTYEFRLVGDMTIKQFMQVASGALISLLLYSSNIAPYVKWPLIIISFLSGIALAFFPIQDRPLSKWIILFIKAIYSPTLYVWDKNASLHQFFQPEEGDITSQPAPVTNSMPIANLPFVASNDSDDVKEVEETKLDETEEAFLLKLDSQFAGPNAIQKGVSITATQPPPTTVNVPEARKTTIEESVAQPQESVSVSRQTSNVGSEVTPIAPLAADTSAKAAIFSTDASPPSPPTSPNVVVGQVLDTEGKIVSGAILEIMDSSGRSVRALRSNNLGHFMIVTPLVNGNYKITVEKDNLQFEPVTFEAKDRIIPPIAIWAKSKEDSLQESNKPDNIDVVDPTSPVTEHSNLTTPTPTEEATAVDINKQSISPQKQVQVSAENTASGNLYESNKNNQNGQ